MSVDLATRPAEEADLPAILELLQESMGRASDARFEDLFRWKHLDNAFGRSPMWVACDGDRIVGLRVLMRWEFERGDDVVRCVRAVDTATHPDYQGRGIFSRLTLDAVSALTDEGIDFVFNTPNAQSLPGYLKMGWKTIGRASARVRPLSPRGAWLVARSRVPAAHWSDPVEFGLPAAGALAEPGIEALLQKGAPDSERFRTRRTSTFLAWRYGTPLLHYRAVATDRGVEAGVAFVRVRRRGAAREVVVAAVLTPDGSPTSTRRLLREVRRAARSSADYLLGIGRLPGAVKLPALGPVVTARTVCTTPPDSVKRFDFTMGDVELF